MRIFFAGFVFFSLFLTAPAHADATTDQAVAAIQNGQHLIDQGGGVSNSASINAGLNASSTHVVVLPDTTVDTFNAKNIAANIQKEFNGKTIVVVIDRGSYIDVAASGPGSSAMASEIQSNYASTRDIGQALSNSMTTLTTSSTVATTGDGSSSAGSITAGDVLLGAGSVTLALLACATAAAYYFKRKNSPAAKLVTYDKLPDDLKKSLEEFKRLVLKHEENVKNPVLANNMRSILTNVQELFKRIDRQGNEQQKRMASLEYNDTLMKLNKALGDNYYLDIEAHPRLWNDPDQRIKAVKDAVAATDSQVVKNIQQVNASQDLDFQAILETIVNQMEQPKVEDLYGEANG